MPFTCSARSRISARGPANERAFGSIEMPAWSMQMACDHGDDRFGGNAEIRHASTD